MNILGIIGEYYVNIYLYNNELNIFRIVFGMMPEN